MGSIFSKEPKKSNKLFHSNCITVPDFGEEDFKKTDKIDTKFKSINPVLSNSQNIQEIEDIKEEDLKRNIIGIKFISMDQRIDCLLACKTSDFFSVIEKKLYQKFPDLNKKNINFLAKGKIIDRATTIIENKIKHGECIMIIENEEDDNEYVDTQEKRILLHFISTDQSIKYDLDIVYKPSDSFSFFLEKLYIRHKYLRNKDLMFLANGNVIDITATIQKNKIKDGDSIIIVENERIIVIRFISGDGRVDKEFDIACQPSDNFSIVEDRLYQEYPDLSYKNNRIYFLMGGYIIDRNATLEANRIKDDCAIVIVELD